MPWSIDILSLDGASTVVSAAPFKSGRSTQAVDGEGVLEVELRPPDVAGGDWLRGQRRLLLKDSAGTPRFQGWLDRLERAGNPGAVGYRATARGLRSVLDRRIVHGDVNQVHVRATDIVKELVLVHIQAQTFDKTNFSDGTTEGTAPFRDRRYCDGTVISEGIRELAEMDPGGFAWEIDELGQLNMWVGTNTRGTNRSGSVTLRPEDVNDWQYVGDTADLVTFAMGLGGDSSSCSRPSTTVNDSLQSTYGRLEAVVEDSTDDTDELGEKAQEELRARIASRSALRATWIEGRGPWSFGDVVLGDVVNAELGAEFGGDAHLRLTSTSVTMEPGLHEFVETTWEAA